MSILDEIRNEEVWNDFFTDKKQRGQLSRKEEAELEVFIREKGWMNLTETMIFDYPAKKQIAKGNSSQKRTVYLYCREETFVLKLITWLLYRYDDRMSARCYSFRKGQTAKTALNDIRAIPHLDSCYVLRADIHNYFNSIDPLLLIPMLETFLEDDPRLAKFLKTLLLQNRCYENGILIEEMRGAMAGVPLSSFFANLYLLELDQMFEAMKIPCFRYSDDILIFTSSAEEQAQAFQILKDFLARRHLSLNPDKVTVSRPHEPWEFLGFRYENSTVDLSRNTIRKMKAKIKRRAHKLYVWRKKNRKGYDETARMMIRSFDTMFYDLFGSGRFVWTRFYFPLLTTADGLHEIDQYFVSCLRFLSSGRYYKGNYRISYDHLKSLGYTPLKAEFYRWKEENRKLQSQL